MAMARGLSKLISRPRSVSSRPDTKWVIEWIIWTPQGHKIITFTRWAIDITEIGRIVKGINRYGLRQKWPPPVCVRVYKAVTRYPEWWLR